MPKVKSAKSVIAKSDEGTIQVTFTIPFEKIKKTKNLVAQELGKGIQIPGFRKGHVPENVLISKVGELSLLEEKEYIGQNPSSILEKPFKDRKYMLRIRGIFLLNKIRYEFPDCAMYFKFFF